MTALEQAAVEMLRKIVAEVAGPGTPYSADSYLPPHLVHDMRQVIEQHERCHGADVDRALMRQPTAHADHDRDREDAMDCGEWAA